MATELLLGVRIGATGGPQTVKEIKAIDDQVKALQKQNERVAATAAALKEAYNLSDAEVKQLTDQLLKLEQQTERAGQEVNTLSKLFDGLVQGAGQQLTQIGFDALRKSAKAVGGTIGEAIRQFEGFETALVQFDAKSTASAEQIARIGEQSKELAAITSQSPAGVAALATALLTLGATADQVEKNLRGITFLADVLGEDPVLTGQVVQTGLNIWGEFGETADTLSDKLNFLINNSAAGAQQGLSEFFQLFADVGGIVKATGADFDDLASAFAVLRNGGASASIAATGIKTALLALAAPTSTANKELKKLGVSAFTSEGEFRGLGAALEDFEAALQGVSEQEQIRVAEAVFGREGAPAFLQALKEANGGIATLRGNLATKAEGSLATALEVINQSLERQADLLQGSIDEALTNFGAALAPIKLAAIEFANALIAGGKEGGAGLDKLAESGQRLREALEANPEAVEAIGRALAGLASELVGGVANAITALANGIEGLSSESIAELGERFSEFVGSALSLAGDLAEVGAVFGQLATNVGVGAVDAFNSLSPALSAAVQFLGAVLSAIEPLTRNTELLSAAMQVLFVRMLALQGLGLAQSLAALVPQFAATGGAAVTAAGGLGAFATAAAAAALPLVALGAAIAAVNFIKFVQDLRAANEELEAYITGLDVSTQTGMQFAGRLNNLNDAITEAGGKATDEQLKKLAEYKRLSEAQVADLERQLAEVRAFEPKNQDQANAQQGLIAQLQTTIGALDKQIGEAETTLAATAANVGQKTGENLTQGVEDGAAANPPDLKSVEDALGDLANANQSALQKIETDSLNARAKLLESGGTQEQIAAEEKAALEKRVAENRKLLGELQVLQAQEGLGSADAAAVAEQIAQVEQQLAQDRVSLAQQLVEAQQKAEADRVKAAQDAAKEITDTLKAQRDEQKRLDEEQFGDTQAQQQQDFGDRQREADKSFQKSQQADAEAFQKRQELAAKNFQESQESAAESFQKSQQADEEAFAERQRQADKAFQAQQQAEAEAFQRRQQEAREQANREFDALGREVENRLALANAATAEERREIQDRIKAEQDAAKQRREVERQVLADQGSILGAAQSRGELELSPLEQARADFEARLQEEAKAFADQQAIEREAFEIQQREAEKAFQEQQELEADAFRQEQESAADAFRQQQESAADAFRQQQESAAEAFADRQRQAERDFQAQQQEAERRFKDEQRSLDEASAQRIAGILEGAERGIAPAQSLRGGGVAEGGLVQVHRDEFLIPPKGTRVVSQAESRQLVRESLMAPASMAAVTMPRLGTQGVEAKLDALLAEVQRGRSAQLPPAYYTIQSAAPDVDLAALEMQRLRAWVRSARL